MHFLIDAQLPPGLARWLAEKGHRSVHVNDLGLGAAPDEAIEAKAREMGAVIWSKDADLAERTRRLHGLQVVWLRVGNTTNASLVLPVSALLTLHESVATRFEKPAARLPPATE